jgi:hypothetical protein
MRRLLIASCLCAAFAVASIADPHELHRSRRSHRQPQSWQSPVVPLDSQSDVLSLLCGDVPAGECLAALRDPNVGQAASSIARNAAKSLAKAIRLAPLLPAFSPNLPQHVLDFALHAHGAIPAATLQHGSDLDVLHEVRQLRRAGVSKRFEAGDTTDYPYFGFLPKYIGAAKLDGTVLSNVNTSCYGNLSMTAAWTNSSNKSVTVSLIAANQVSFLCTDTFAAGLYGLGMKFLTVALEGTTTFEFHFDAATADSSKLWYVEAQGVRLLQFNKGLLGLILDVVDTVTLIAGFGQSPVTNTTMQANFEFMHNYIQASTRMQPAAADRTAGTMVADMLNESYIQSGDSLVVVRYDGLDPVIGWGEGFTGGHSTIAIRDPVNGTLYVCESTATDAYWVTNGIQCHLFREWITLANKAEYNVLLAPLSPEKAAAFNTTAALQFFYENQGFNYGYLNFLFGWIDTRTDNFPCLPPNYEYCLGEPLVEMIALLWDSLSGDVPNNVFRQALNHRLGMTNLTVFQVMETGAKQGLTFPDIYIRPEQDAWYYHTVRYNESAIGRAMVCCVFVCNMWKEGGLFDSIDREINCGEQTLWDIFSMQVFDAKKMNDGRPDVCKQADPDNALCQLIGTHTFHAKPDFNTRPLYAKMGQKCSSITPDYIRAPGC